MTALLEDFPESEDFSEWQQASDSGDSCLEEENFEEASEYYRKAAQLSRTFAPRLNHLKSISWTSLGRSLMKEMKYGEAVIAYQTAIPFSSGAPDLGLIWGFLGRAFYFDDKPTESQEAFLQATWIDPDDWGAWTEAGFSFDYEDKWPESEMAYGEAVRADPNNEWAWRGLGYSRSMQDDQWHPASEAYQKALEIDPEHPGSWMELSICWARLKRYDDSEEAMRRAVSIYPNKLGAELYRLGKALFDQGEFRRCIEIYRLITVGVHDPTFHFGAWAHIAEAQIQSKYPASEVIASYKEMSLAIEHGRQQEKDWVERVEQNGDESQALKEAANYASIHQFDEDALGFSVQSKTRGLLDLIDFDSVPKTEDNFRNILSGPDFEKFLTLKKKQDDLQLKTREADYFRFLQRLNHPDQARRLYIRAPVTDAELKLMEKDVEECSQRFASKVLPKYPQFSDPSSKPFDFQINNLCHRLKHGEAVLELVCDPEYLLSFLVTPKGLVRSHRLPNKIATVSEHHIDTVKAQLIEIFSTLDLGGDSRAEVRAKKIKGRLDQGCLERWGHDLYGPFNDDLKDIKRLWVSPNSVLTQLPFNAIPFPDGVERTVAIIPSPVSLTRPQPKGPRPTPRFTLGVVAADPVKQKPLDLLSEEVRHLRGTVKSAKLRWELAGRKGKVGEEPTLANIQKRIGLTKCLVFSCHGAVSDDSWGSLLLGDQDNPEEVTGRELIYGLLSGGRRDMEADIFITSACLTGQVDYNDDEWLGLPMALESVWKTKAMLLTLWEVEELPTMIWVVELVKALTQGLSAGEAQKIAQGKVKGVTKSEIQAVWLAEAKRRLPEERWRRVDNQWRETSRSTGRCPFSEPVHWAPFILIGDPKVTI